MKNEFVFVIFTISLKPLYIKGYNTISNYTYYSFLSIIKYSKKYNVKSIEKYKRYVYFIYTKPRFAYNQ